MGPKGKVLAVAFWLLIWQLGAMALGQELVLVTPVAVVAQLGVLLPQGAFWQAVGYSFARIVLGFALALALGGALAALSYAFAPLRTLLWPPFAAIKATPVASFIILCLILFTSRQLSVFISFLMVLPVVYTNLLRGLEQTDRQLLEMARVFGVGPGRRVRYLYLPQLRPYLESACAVSLGLCWKAGIAGEVIGIPTGSIGEQLYLAKLYLNSRDLFAWTAVVVAVSMAFEKLFLAGLRLLYRRLERSRPCP